MRDQAAARPGESSISESGQEHGPRGDAVRHVERVAVGHAFNGCDGSSASASNMRRSKKPEKAERRTTKNASLGHAPTQCADSVRRCADQTLPFEFFLKDGSLSESKSQSGSTCEVDSLNGPHGEQCQGALRCAASGFRPRRVVCRKKRPPTIGDPRANQPSALQKARVAQRRRNLREAARLRAASSKLLQRMSVACRRMP